MRWFLLALLALVFMVSSLPVAYLQSARFEHKHSLRSPFYLGRGGALPFWEFGGGALVNEDYIRITPAMQSRSGWIWNTEPAAMKDWELEVELKASGGLQGADGLGIWYVADTKQVGPAMGNADKWKGLGVILDSFDNDGKGDSPRISIVINDGSVTWKPDRDGKDIEQAGCTRNWRGTRIKVKITYKDRMLEVWTEKVAAKPEFCGKVETDLPTGYFFGVTAATGQLTDNHDLYSFSTYDLSPASTAPANDEAATRRSAQVEEEPEKKEPKLRKSAASTDDILSRLASLRGDQEEEVAQVEEEVATLSRTVKSRSTSTTTSNIDAAIKKLNDRVTIMQNKQKSITKALDRIESELANKGLGSNKNNNGGAAFAEAFRKLLATALQSKQTAQNEVELIQGALTEIENQLYRNSPSQEKELLEGIAQVKVDLHKVSNVLQAAGRDSKSLVSDFKADTEMLATSVEGSSSGFWMYFLVLQVLATSAFVWWKHKKEKRKFS
ncbi:Protein ERGIC-53 [Balamuthia mandrillaris]